MSNNLTEPSAAPVTSRPSLVMWSRLMEPPWALCYMTCLWERMSNTDTTPSFSPAVAIKFVSAVLLMSILDTPALCSYLVKMGVPLLMSHQVTVPLRSPDTHRL